LDLEAVNELERALQEFNWNLIVVSHDKGFIENIKFDREYRMDEGILR
jgi:ATPase subunit of ABC transporter with duplicated ATPase domains